MDKKEQFNSDKKVLASLEAEYKRAQRVIYSIRALVTDLNFEELIPDSQERCLMVDELQAYDYIRTNLMNRIRFYRNRVKANKPEPWEEDSAHHCGQDAVNFEQLSDNLTDTYKDYCRGVFEQFLSREITWAKFVEKVALPFCHENVNEFVNAIKEGRSDCGQGASCPVGGGCATVQDQNESQPADAVPESLKELVGMQIVSAFPPGWKCQGCAFNSDYFRCEKKVELVGGTYLCLAPLPNSIATE